MIGKVLVFLRDQLNAYLEEQSGRRPDESTEARVVFVDGEKTDPLVFPLGAVSALLVNIEEEHLFRGPDPYVQVQRGGAVQAVQPEIRLYLHVLFVARFKKYEEGLDNLSAIIQYFQQHRVFDRRGAPGLPGEVEQLVMELTTLPASGLNELWGFLRTSYHPSVLYRVKMVVFREAPAVAQPVVTRRDVEVAR